MAVNLKATATLNGKPFLATLSELSAATSKLSTETIKGNTASRKGIDGLIGQHEKAAKAATTGADKVAKSYQRANRTFKEGAVDIGVYNKSLGSVQKTAKSVTSEYSKMTPAVARLTEAKQRLATSERALAKEVAQGLEGPAYDKMNERVLRDARAVGKAQAAIERDLNSSLNNLSKEKLQAEKTVNRALDDIVKQRTASQLAAERTLNKSLNDLGKQRAAERLNNERTLNKALDSEASRQAAARGAANAANFRAAIAGMTAEEAALTQARNRVATAEQGLARAYTTGRGIAAAESGLIRAEQGYKKLSAAQEEVAKSTGKSIAGLSSQRYLYHDVSRQLTQFTAGMAVFPIAAIAAGAAWEKDFAAVVRTSNLKSDLQGNRVEIEALRDSLVSMAQAMPASFGDITAAATLANQMGIAAEDTAKFTQAVVMFSETSGVNVETTASAFGRLKTLVADVGSDYIGLSDSILKVGVNSVATEDEIINVTTQISSIAASAGFSSKEMIGLSGALASVRVPPELSRGVVTRVFGQIDKAVANGGTSLDTLARISGRTSEQFKAQWGTDAAGTLFRDFVKGLNDAGSAARGEIESLGIKSVRDVPVLMRLATAADSEGNIGGLLTQTMNDARNAAGETQEQYEIMSETVVAKLKVLGNNVVAFFDGIGQSSMGPFGDMLETVSNGIRNLTRDLDEPARLFGSIRLPWTNAEALGFIANLSLMAAGITLLGSVATKMAAGAVGLKQLGKIIAGSTLGKSVATGLAGSGIGTALGGVTGQIGQASTAFAAMGRVGGAALGTVARIATGPVGLGITAIALAGKVFADNYYEATTSVKEFNSALAAVDADNMIAINNALSDIKVSGANQFWSRGELTKSVQPFNQGIEDYRKGIDALIKASEQGAAGGWSKDNWLTNWGYEMGQWGARNGAALWDEVDGMKLVDEGIKNLVDSGNGDRALSMVRNLHGDLDQLKYTLQSDEGKSIKELLENSFGTAGIEMSDANLYKFLTGDLKELIDTRAGLAEADKIGDTLFAGDIEAAGQFANAIDEASAAFIDFGGAMEKGWSDGNGGQLETFSLAQYTDELDKSIKAQADWAEDIITISGHASSGLIEELAGLGPAAAPMLEQLADELAAGSTNSLDKLEKALEAKTIGIGNAVAESMANKSWAKQILGDAGMASNLTAALGDDKMSQLYDRSVGVGDNIVRNVMQGLTRGDITFDEALQTLLNEQPLSPTISWDKMASDGDGAAAMERAFSALSVKLKVDVDSETTVGDLKSQLDDPELKKLDIDGELTLTEAYEQSREFQVWARQNKIDMFLGLNTLPGELSVAALVAYAKNQDVTVEIDALPTPAEGAVWDIVTLADGTRAYVQIDGENQLAMDSIFQIDAETGEVREVQIDGDNVSALNKILAVRDEASATPATINVTANDLASGTIDHIARPRTATITITTEGGGEFVANPGAGTMVRANGGIVDYYANGGVRESHTAQIAPAGTMRVWAEPETGGEAYIPLARSKRLRSEAILNDVAARFGYALQPQNYTQYADGGQYMAQAMSRQRVAAPTSRGVGGDSKVNIGAVNFGQGNQTDQFREFSRHINRIARGL